MPKGRQGTPLVGEFVVPPSNDISKLAYVNRIDNNVYYGYRWLKTEGNNSKNYFSPEAALSLGTSGNKVFTMDEFLVKFQFLIEPLQYRKDHPTGAQVGEFYRQNISDESMKAGHMGVLYYVVEASNPPKVVEDRRFVPQGKSFNEGIPYWSKPFTPVLDGWVNARPMTKEEVEQKYPETMAALPARLENLEVEWEKKLAQEDVDRLWNSLTSDPLYQTETAEAAKLYPQLTALGISTLETDHTDLVSELENAIKKRDRVIAKLEEKIAEARAECEEVRTDKEAAKEKWEAAKKETTRLKLLLGECWFNVKNLANRTGQWSKWLTSEAQKVCKGITVDEVKEQLKMYEEWYTPVPDKALRDEIIAQGIKATKATIATAKQVLAEMAVEATKAAAPEAAKADESAPSDPAPDETTGATPPTVDNLPQQVAELVQQPMSEDGQKRISEMAQQIYQRTKAKVTASRSAAGARGGAGNKAANREEEPPVAVQYSFADRRKMAYHAIAEQIMHVPRSEQYDWLLDLCAIGFGTGLSESGEISFTCIQSPDSWYFRFKVEDESPQHPEVKKAPQTDHEAVIKTVHQINEPPKEGAAS